MGRSCNMATDLSAELKSLSLSARGKSPRTACIKGSDDFNLDLAISKVRQTFGEHLSPSSDLFKNASNPQHEATLWECFAEVFERELAQQKNSASCLELKRRILADIFVWAELTQKNYDQSTFKFVVEPNKADASFVRIGSFFKDAKAKRGLD